MRETINVLQSKKQLPLTKSKIKDTVSKTGSAEYRHLLSLPVAACITECQAYELITFLLFR